MQSYRIRIPSYDSIERYEVASRALTQNYDYSCKLAEDILAGRYGFMCQYIKGLGYDTLWSIAIDLKSDRIFRAEGNPSKASFKEDSRLKIIKKKRGRK